jgi:hypothetical protein
MLVGVDDVETGIGEEAADGGDQPRAVGAGEKQPGCGGDGDRRMMAVSEAFAEQRRC